MSDARVAKPCPLNWWKILVRSLLLYMLTWLGLSAWMTYDGQGSLRDCLLRPGTARAAGRWFALLAAPFGIIMGIISALCSRELAARWKVLIAALAGIIAMEGLWIIGTTEHPLPDARPSLAGANRRAAPFFKLGPKDRGLTQVESLQHRLAALMRGLHQYQGTPAPFYDLDAYTKDVLRSNHLQPATAQDPD